jgi:hypothetical protein
MVALLGREGGGERAAVLVGQWWGVLGSEGCWRRWGFVVALLGQRRHYWGVRAVAAVGRREREVTINMLLGGACSKARGWGGHGVHNCCH